jgi:hypothetical protein
MCLPIEGIPASWREERRRGAVGGLRSEVGGRRSEVGGRRWSGQHPPALSEQGTACRRSEREGLDRTRIGRGITRRGGRSAILPHGGSESNVSSGWAPSPRGPSLPRRRGSRGIHCIHCSLGCVGGLTSARPLFHLTQPLLSHHAACCEGWTWRGEGRD